MTAPSDPALPRDPAAYRRGARPALGLWSLLALCGLCLLVGAGAALVAPRLLADRAPPAPAPRSALAAAPPAVAPAPKSALAAVDGVDTAEIARLNARIATLENQGARTSEAAAAALAASVLVETTQGSKPFAAELAALRRAAPDLPELAALARVAETGAPSRAALAAAFPEYAARAATAARRPAGGAKLGDRMVYAMSRVVSVRRVGDVSGAGPDAALARAERALAEGDTPRALRALEALPPGARAALAPWRTEAERRAEIDRQVAALRARAADDLATPEAAPPAPANQAPATEDSAA
jgi:hypothetical protein